MDHVEPAHLEHDGWFEGIINIYVENEKIDLALARRLGIEAVFYRTAVGLVPGRDDRVAYRAAKAKARALDLLWGAFYVVSGAPVDDQLEQMLAIEDGSDGKTTLVLDWEETSKGIMTGEALCEIVTKFERRTGFLPMIYGGNVLREAPVVQAGSALLGACPLWYIRILDERHHDMKMPAATWRDWTLWQFSTDRYARNPPYPNDVFPGADWSRFKGDAAALRAAWPLHGTLPKSG